MRLLIAAVLVLITLGGCSHKVTVGDLEGFEITVSTQDDVLRKVGAVSYTHLTLPTKRIV